MGPALVVRSHEKIGVNIAASANFNIHHRSISPRGHVRGFASLAGRAELEAIHKKEGIRPAQGAPAIPGVCPVAHRGQSHTASGAADTLAHGKSNPASTPSVFATAAAAAGGAGVCPFSGVPSLPKAETKTETSKNDDGETAGLFSYESFYNAELEKKHQDQSYRYFNNINRLAAKFPVAHTARVVDEVDVWCSNDYLGMGRNPTVLETMQ
jgi:5-aminolevulinate synthase